MKITTCDQAASLWIEYQEGIRSYLLKKVKDADLANDLAQEVFIKVCRACCSDHEVKNVRSWLFQISHHALIDHLKRQPNLAALPLEIADEPEDTIWQEMEKYIDPLIKLLPEKYAIPLRLYDLEGIQQAVIAQRLALSLSATKTRIQRARKLLKEEILVCSTLETDVQGRVIGFSIKKSCKPLQDYQRKNE